MKQKAETFKIQDDKALKYANGTLNSSIDGGVYFTDTSGSGKRRAETMQKLDQYIDEHGGTPTAPKGTNDTELESAQAKFHQDIASHKLLIRLII